MKKYIFINVIFSIVLLHAVTATGQNVPDMNLVTETPTLLPVPANNAGRTKYNFIRTFTPWEPIQSDAALQLSGWFNFHVSTDYLNGWGKSLQTNVRGEIYEEDIITPHDLRPSHTQADYLPYNSGLRSKFRAARFNEQKNFYNNLYNDEGGVSYGLSRTEFANSEVITKQYEPGKSYAGKGRGVEVKEIFNTYGIHRFSVNDNNGQLITLFNEEYAPGTLRGKEYKEMTLDQQYDYHYEFYDKEGKIVCKYSICNAEAAETYYIYDIFGRLRYILPPNAITALRQNFWDVSSVYASGLYYRYDYDRFGKTVATHTPDKDGDESFVYDKKKRLVLYQSPLMANDNKWEFTIYDNADRPVVSGIVDGAAVNMYTKEDWATAIGNLAYASTHTTQPQALIEFFDVGFLGTYPTYIASCDVQRYNYYDSYDGYINTGNTITDQPQKVFDNGYTSDYLSDPQYVIPTPYYFTIGSLTASKTKILDDNNVAGLQNTWIESVYYYDQKGRQIQALTRKPWNLSNWDVVTQQYNFGGEAVNTISMQYGVVNAAIFRSKTELRNEPNDVNSSRIDRVMMSIDDRAFVNVAYQTFDRLGRLSSKTIGGINLQNYSYNMRGKLTGINQAAAAPGGSFTNNMTFAESLHYEKGFTARRYDGKISGFTWRTPSTNASAYGYSYDEMGRLTKADYRDHSFALGPYTTPYWNNVNRDYSLSEVTYDLTGNIQTLQHRGPDVNNVPATIDDLSYSYQGNRLMVVTDAGNASPIDDFDNGGSGGGIDYSYDVNGNLTSDANKGITQITYNYNNQPKLIVSSEGTVQNVYDADGTLVFKKTYENATSTQQYYRHWGQGVYKYNAGTSKYELSYLLHPEGRCRWLPDSSKFKYDYFVKDHMDNVRNTVTADEYERIDDYSATYELMAASTERLIFQTVDEVRAASPTGTPANAEAAMLNGQDPNLRIGTSLAVRVMAGDRIGLGTYGYYEMNGDMNSHVTAEDMMGSILAVLGGAQEGAIITGEVDGGTTIGNLINGENYMNTFDALKEGQTRPEYPRAYLNYLIFDENMTLLPEKSGVRQLEGEPNTWVEMTLPEDIVIDQNGYMVTYISNEQYMDTYFDDLQVKHYRGRLLEEQHYYPHGMLIKKTIAQNGQGGNGLENKFQYQGKLMEDEAGQGLYDFGARQYDPQTGRFLSPDPMNQYASGYVGMGNDPANLVDPTGMRTQSNAQGNSSTGGGANWEDYSDSQNIIYRGTENKGGGGGGSSAPINTSSGVAGTDVGSQMHFMSEVNFSSKTKSAFARLWGNIKDGFSDAVSRVSKLKFGFNSDDELVVESTGGGGSGVNTKAEPMLESAGDGGKRKVEGGQNMFGDNYTGSKNPEGYDLAPKNNRDQISMDHDKAYDAFGAKGPNSLLLDGRVGPVDYRFVNDQINLGGNLIWNGMNTPPPAGGYYILEGAKSILIGGGMFIFTIPKTIFNNPYRP